MKSARPVYACVPNNLDDCKRAFYKLYRPYKILQAKISYRYFSSRYDSAANVHHKLLRKNRKRAIKYTQPQSSSGWFEGPWKLSLREIHFYTKWNPGCDGKVLFSECQVLNANQRFHVTRKMFVPRASNKPSNPQDLIAAKSLNTPRNPNINNLLLPDSFFKIYNKPDAKGSHSTSGNPPVSKLSSTPINVSGKKVYRIYKKSNLAIGEASKCASKLPASRSKEESENESNVKENPKASNSVSKLEDFKNNDLYLAQRLLDALKRNELTKIKTDRKYTKGHDKKLVGQTRLAHKASDIPATSPDVEGTTKTVITSTKGKHGCEISVVEMFGTNERLSEALEGIEKMKAALALTTRRDHPIENPGDTKLENAVPVEDISNWEPISYSKDLCEAPRTSDVPKRRVVAKRKGTATRRRRTARSSKKRFKESLETVNVIKPNQIDSILGLPDGSEQKFPIIGESKAESKQVKLEDNQPEPKDEAKLTSRDKAIIDGLIMNQPEEKKPRLSKLKESYVKIKEFMPKRVAKVAKPDEDLNFSQQIIEKMIKELCNNPSIPVEMRKDCELEMAKTVEKIKEKLVISKAKMSNQMPQRQAEKKEDLAVEKTAANKAQKPPEKRNTVAWLQEQIRLKSNKKDMGDPSVLPDKKTPMQISFQAAAGIPKKRPNDKKKPSSQRTYASQSRKTKKSKQKPKTTEALPLEAEKPVKDTSPPIVPYSVDPNLEKYLSSFGEPTRAAEPVKNTDNEAIYLENSSDLEKQIEDVLTSSIAETQSYLLFNLDKISKEVTPLFERFKEARSVATFGSKLCPTPENHILNFPIINPLKPFLYDPPKESILSINFESKPTLKFELKTIPSITTVLNSTMAEESKGALSIWRRSMISKLGSDGFKKFYKDNMKSGTDFQSGVRKCLRQSKLRMNWSATDNMYIKSARHVLSDLTDVSVLESHVVHPRLGYRGIIDCVAKYKNNPVVVEWRKHDSMPTHQQLSDALVQLSAYIGALNYDNAYNMQVHDGMILVAYSDGSPADVIILEVKDREPYWQHWLMRLKAFVSAHHSLNKANQ